MSPPERIYLQVDPEGEGSMGHEGVTWCSDKINKTDVEYIQSSRVREELEKRIQVCDDIIGEPLTAGPVRGKLRQKKSTYYEILEIINP